MRQFVYVRLRCLFFLNGQTKLATLVVSSLMLCRVCVQCIHVRKLFDLFLLNWGLKTVFIVKWGVFYWHEIFFSLVAMIPSYSKAQKTKNFQTICALTMALLVSISQGHLFCTTVTSWQVKMLEANIGTCSLSYNLPKKCKQCKLKHCSIILENWSLVFARTQEILLGLKMLGPNSTAMVISCLPRAYFPSRRGLTGSFSVALMSFSQM